MTSLLLVQVQMTFMDYFDGLELAMGGRAV
jgi:hypothetical protein